MKTSITTTVEVELSIEQGAAWFSELDDDSQAKFFVEVARIAEGWTHNSNMQWWLLGGHLRNCSCSTEAARDMIRTIAEGMEKSTHGAEPTAEPATARDGGKAVAR